MSVTTPSTLRLLLLCRLSEAFPQWGVWKNVDRMLQGEGDIDSIAPASSWPGIRRTFEEWAFAQGSTAIVACRHVPGVLLLTAVSRESSTLMELDLCDECYWRGSVLLTASVVMPLMVEDPRGFHVLRAGAQGLFLLLLNGVQRGGRPDIQAIRDKGLIDLLSSDPDGVLGAARTLGLAQNDAIRLVEAVLNSDWRRALALRLEARAFIRALLSPRPLAYRLAFRARAYRKCPVIRATREGRRTPDDIDWWLQTASDSHSVVWARAK